MLNSEALVDAHFGDAAWKEVLPREERCTSLMGPSCFYRADSGVASWIIVERGVHVSQSQTLHKATIREF